MSEDPQVQTPGVRLALRPGTQVFVISADEVQVAAVNHSTTFTGIPVVRVVAAIAEALAVEDLVAGPTRVALVGRVAEGLAEAPPLVEYVLEMMLQTGCLVWRGDAGPARLDALGEFYAAIGVNPDAAAPLLAAARPVVVAPATSADVMRMALADAGMADAVIEAPEGAACEGVLERLRAAMDAAPGPLVCWDVPWRMPFARLVNELAVERRRALLFGVCEGAIGRLGPYVLPQNTACLECVNIRLLGNSGELEGRVALSYRTRLADRVPGPAPAHPAFRRAMAGLLAVELSQIVLLQPPTTLGGYLEYVFGGIGARRHPTLKVPRCPVCHPGGPPRLAWDARFPAPLVKSGAA